MRVVWKYLIRGNGNDLSIPEGAVLVNGAYLKSGEVALWFDLDSSKPSVVRKFRVFGTGREIPENMIATHVCSVIEPNPLQNFVWHIYEVTYDPSPNLD